MKNKTKAMKSKNRIYNISEKVEFSPKQNYWVKAMIIRKVEELEDNGQIELRYGLKVEGGKSLKATNGTEIYYLVNPENVRPIKPTTLELVIDSDNAIESLEELNETMQPYAQWNNRANTETNQSLDVWASVEKVEPCKTPLPNNKEAEESWKIWSDEAYRNEIYVILHKVKNRSITIVDAGNAIKEIQKAWASK